MRAIAYGGLGFGLGSLGGFWVGLMLGLIYVDFARVTCFEGHCGYVAGGFGLGGALLLGVISGAFGIRRAAKERELKPCPIS